MIFDKGERFRYFYNVLHEINVIIKLNWDIKDTDTPKLIKIIERHIDNYNLKNSLIRLAVRYDDETKRLEYYSSYYMHKRGFQKEFKDVISIKKFKREQKIDTILAALEKIDEYEC
jgi:hypothetical protein